MQLYLYHWRKNLNNHEILSHFEKRQQIVYIHDSKLTTKHYIAVNHQEWTARNNPTYNKTNDNTVKPGYIKRTYYKIPIISKYVAGPAKLPFKP